jgi:hypothetical protein
MTKWSLALKIQEAGYSETTASIYETERYHNSEDHSFMFHRHENLKSHLNLH